MENRRKAAIVTGGGKGIGAAIATRLAKDGMNVMIHCHSSKAQAEETAEACRRYGVSAEVVTGDVSSEEDCIKLVDSCIQAFSGIDVLVNNAGVTRDGLLMRMPTEDFTAVLQTNLMSAFYMMKAASRHMLRARYGKIISLSSVSALSGNPGQGNYAASKAGLIGLTRSLALETAARGITVNCIAPGAVDTDMTKALPERVREEMVHAIPMGRMADPEEIAGVASFLASDDSRYVTGQVINVSGGLVI